MLQVWIGRSLDCGMFETGKFIKIVRWNTDKPKTCAYKSTKIDKASNNSTEQNYYQKIYASMACMYSNVESPRRDFGESLQLTNWILESGATCHMT